MKKYILDLRVVENSSPHPRYALLKLTHDSKLPEMLPGQFAEIRAGKPLHQLVFACHVDEVLQVVERLLIYLHTLP